MRTRIMRFLGPFLQPATLEASTNVDAYGLFPGSALQKTDGEQAYIQAPLGGIKGRVKTQGSPPPRHVA